MGSTYSSRTVVCHTRDREDQNEHTTHTHMQQQEASEKMTPVVMSPDTGVSGLGMRLRMLYTLSQSIERKYSREMESFNRSIEEEKRRGR